MTVIGWWARHLFDFFSSSFFLSFLGWVGEGGVGGGQQGPQV